MLPDGRVNYADLAHLVSKMYTDGHGQQDRWADLADINRDGKVDLADFAVMSENWGWSGVPEGD